MSVTISTETTVTFTGDSVEALRRVCDWAELYLREHRDANNPRSYDPSGRADAIINGMLEIGQDYEETG